jgi:hypothetical protein
MSKVISFLVIVPFMVLIIYKSILFYEFDTKQRYIKDLSDNLAYKVKITGILTPGEYNEYFTKLNKVSRFESYSVILRQGRYIDGAVSDWSAYMPGNALDRGQAFFVYVKSADVPLYSRLQNGGVMSADDQNLHFVAKAQCRIEKDY